MLYMLYTGEI